MLQVIPMRAIRIAAILLFAIVVASAPAAADDAARAAAQELVDFTMGRTVDDLVAKMSAAMLPGLQAALPGDVDPATITDIKADFDRIAKKYVSQAMKIAPDVYAQHFTADELRQMLAFYKTPLGDKMLIELPKVMADFMGRAMVPLMGPMQSELQETLEITLRKHGVMK
jgi:uncharacterized protein